MMKNLDQLQNFIKFLAGIILTVVGAIISNETCLAIGLTLLGSLGVRVATNKIDANKILSMSDEDIQKVMEYKAAQVIQAKHG